MMAAIRSRIRRNAAELLFLVAAGASLFLPGVPYRSYVGAAIPVMAWIVLDRLWRLRLERARLRRLQSPYLLKIQLEDV